MSLLSKVGAFNTGTGAAATTVAVTGVGFQPKAIMFWWVGSATTPTTDSFVGGSVKRGFGVATSATSRWAVASQSEDAQAASNTDRSHYEDACIATITVTGTLEGLMDLQSLDADGFTLVVDDAFPQSWLIHYMALGGTDITNASTGRFDAAAATGTQDITSAGFQPNFVLFGSVANPTDPPSITTIGALMVGAATSSSAEAVLLGRTNNNADPMEADAYCRTGECIAMGLGPTFRAEFDSFLSNGFRINWLEAIAGGQIVFYLALQGGSYWLDNFLTSTSNGATITETGFGFAPKGTMLFSAGRAEDTQNVMTAHDALNVGGFTSTTERGSQGMFDEDNVGTSDIERYVEFDAALAQITATPSLVGLVDVQSIDADGFTLVMDSAASPAAFVWYVSFGDTAGAATENPYPYVGGGYYPT